MNKYLLVLLGAVGIIAGSITSCHKDNGTGRLQVKLMDAPSPYDFDAIYLDVVGVEVNVEADGADPKWFVLSTGAGVYNIMTLVNGSDVVLANAELPAGRLTQIRLILGDGNTIVVDGVSHQLVIPSGDESGLKINVGEDIGDGDELTLMLDFDAAHSINVQGNGGYHLKPVMRGVILERAGTVHGTVTAVHGSVAVVAVAGTREFTTYADPETNQFLLRGLPPGTYNVNVYYPDSDHAVVFDNVIVTAGAVTELEGVGH